MKSKFLLLTMLIFMSGTLSAQVSYSPMNVESLKNAPFKFKGKRVLMSERVDTDVTKNIFLFTKAERGASPDTLFIQQFRKNEDTWSLVKDTTITSDETIILWENRKAFVPKEGQLLTYFTYCTGNPVKNTTSAVYLIAYYSDAIYTLTEKTGERKTLESPNFGELPQSVSDKIYDFWRELDRWK